MASSLSLLLAAPRTQKVLMLTPKSRVLTLGGFQLWVSNPYAPCSRPAMDSTIHSVSERRSQGCRLSVSVVLFATFKDPKAAGGMLGFLLLVS